MKVVVDANVVIAALAKQSITREILLYPYLDCYTPDFLIEELDEHGPEIQRKIGPRYPSALELILRKLRVVGYEQYEASLEEAGEIIGKVDKDDIPYIAAALSIDADGIWSYDPHFLKQRAIKVISTRELARFMKGI